MSSIADSPLVQELVPPPDPASCCERLAGVPYRLFFDSAAFDGRLGRYSFIAGDPSLVLRAREHRVEITSPGEHTSREVEGNVLDIVRGVLAPYETSPVPNLPPFQGGAAGYIGYEWARTLERIPAPQYDDLPIPDVILGIYDWVLAWDHQESRAWLISTGLPERGLARKRRAAERAAAVRTLLASSRPHEPVERSPAIATAATAPSFPVEGTPGAGAAGLRSSFTRDGYLDGVRRVREYILAGDIFQANLSQRFEARLEESSWDFYRRLRASSPAPFAAFLDFPEVSVLSASPERFLAVDAGGHVETRPIKGTRPRGLGPEHDWALGQALRESDKDQAENLMIVDLMRNDLSRVCRPGSVRVSELFALESYATVHHLVSAVVGDLADGRDALALLQAAFPGGSITGAPKLRAMEIIAEIEPSRRGVYCGSIGYLSVTRALDMNIAIRTAIALDGRVYFSAGGAVVADSQPEQEYIETLVKAQGFINALAASTHGSTHR